MRYFELTHKAILILCFFALSPVWAEKSEEDGRTDLSPLSRAAKKAGIDKFRPDMLGHFHPGCPSNSSCSKKMGQKRQKWNDLLKEISTHSSDKSKVRKKLENFRRKVGVPFSLWTTIESEELDFTAKDMPEVISWRSQCNQHQAPEDSEKSDRQAIYMSEVMVKSLKNIPKDQGNSRNRYIFNKAFLNSNSGPPKRYFLPRDETPLMLKGSDLIFLREQNGQYYSLSISPNGELHIGPSQSPKVYPQETKCPTSLQKAFARDLKENNLEHLYQQFFCQKIWNSKTQKTETMIFGWSCP